jgi:FixJ family two-component response regulator
MTAVCYAIGAKEKQLAEQTLAGVARQRIASLSADELKVYRLLTSGEQNKQIAAILGIGLRTVELRRATLLKKMAASSLPELVRLAILGGLTSEPSP